MISCDFLSVESNEVVLHWTEEGVLFSKSQRELALGAKEGDKQVSSRGHVTVM